MCEPNHLDRLLPRWSLFAILLLAAVLHLWGLGRDLPYTAEVDEPTFVSAAVQMVATGSLNPHWFGHPGATLIYPLAAFYHIEQALVHNGPLFRPMLTIQARFDAEDPSLYFFGRLLAVAYALATIPLLYHLGMAAFGRRPVALLVPFLFTLYPFATLHARWIRTDSPSIFFTVLALWLCLRLLTRPKLPNQLAAGAAIGLAVATKYYLLVLVLVFVAANLFREWQAEKPNRHGATNNVKNYLTWLMAHLWQREVVLGIAAVFITFALASPYFFLDWPAVRANLIFEARSIHPGADGLLPPGNLAWYLSTALPSLMTWPQLPFLVAGLFVALRDRQPHPRLLLLFVLPFLIGISLSPLHQQRWLLPALPVLALFTAAGLWAGITRIHRAQTAFPTAVITGGLVVLVTALPAYHLRLLNIQLSRPSTRVLAGAWIQANLPAGSAIALEEYTAPGSLLSRFSTLRTFALGWNEMTLSDYVAEGYDYLVVSDEMYNRFLAQPDRFPDAAAFYEQLFAQGRLLQEFRPSLTRGGPLIRIYEVNPDATSAFIIPLSAPSRARFADRVFGPAQTARTARPFAKPAPSL